MAQRKKRLLIVDDSEIDCGVLKSILWDEYTILAAENGYEGLDLMIKQKSALDAVLLDVSMPVLDGFDVLELIQKKKLDSYFPVFLITSEATKDNVERAMKYNIADFIRKPFERVEILKRLRIKLNDA